MPGVTDSLGYLPTFPPSSSFLAVCFPPERLKIVNFHHPNSMALRTGACDPILVSFSRKVLFFCSYCSSRKFTWVEPNLNFVFSAVGGHQFLSLAGLRRAFPMHAWFRAQAEIWIELIRRIWGSLSLGLFFQEVPLYFPTVLLPLNSVPWFFKPVKLWISVHRSFS